MLTDIPKYPGIQIDADEIAAGMIRMMREQDEDNIRMIRFGILPAAWMGLAETGLEGVMRSRLNDTDADVWRGFVGDSFYEELSIKDLVAAAMRELAVAIYRRVNMVA